jgi:hypothetical protein
MDINRYLVRNSEKELDILREGLVKYLTNYIVLVYSVRQQDLLPSKFGRYILITVTGKRPNKGLFTSKFVVTKKKYRCQKLATKNNIYEVLARDIELSLQKHHSFKKYVR